MSFKDHHPPNHEGDEPDNRRSRALSTNLETLAYALSHDLRAPLRAIEGFAQALSEDIATSSTIPESATYNLSEIRASVSRMQELIGKWLSFMRNDNDYLRREAVSLSELAESVVTELRAADSQRNVAVIIAPDLNVYGDRVLLRELLQNLFGNAWKFTAHKHESAIIELGASRRSGMNIYFVRDNGIGISALDTQQAFEPFVRLHEAASFDGTGIGLTIVRRIVEAHGGTVWAESEAGKGATIRFTLPASLQDPSGHAALWRLPDEQSHSI